MPQFDRQEKTLVYRVELDESSLAQSIRTARETVGVGLSQAADQAMAVGQAVNVTAATAAARIGSHLEFMERTRQVLAAPDETRAAAHGLGVMRALGVKAGIVSPRFSETMASLESRADSAVLGDPTGVKGMQRAATFTNMSMFAMGVGLMFTGFGAVPGAILTAGSVASSLGAEVGFDRGIQKKMLAAHMRDVGMGSATRIVDEFETYVNQQRVSFREAMEVGQAALSSIPRAMQQNPTRLRDTLIAAVETWGQVGKAFGMEKEDALATTTELFRLGIDPMALRGSTYLGGISNLSKQFGINPGAMNSVAMDVMRQSMVAGYDALSAGNLFQLQTSMVAQMTRSGVLTRGDLAMAAGFSGPQSEMQLAAAQRMMQAGIHFRETSTGSAINAGLMMGGQGNYMDLIARASTMTSQQMLEFRSKATTGGDMTQQNLAVVDMMRDLIERTGNKATPAALEGQLMGVGYDQGTARMMSRMNRADIGTAQFGAMSSGQYEWEQGNSRAGFFGFFGGKAAGVAGGWAAGQYQYVMKPTGRFFSDLWRWTGAAAYRKLWSDWELDPIEGFREGVSTNALPVALATKFDEEHLSYADRREMRGEESRLQEDYRQRYVRKGYETESRRGFQRYLNERDRIDMGKWLNKDNNRDNVIEDMRELRDTQGVSLTEEQVLRMLPMRELFMANMNKLTGKDRAQAREDFTRKVQGTLGIDQNDATRVANYFMNNAIYAQVTEPADKASMVVRERLHEDSNTLTGIMLDKDMRGRLAGMLFKQDSASYRALAEADKGMSEKDLVALAQRGFNSGDANRQFVVKGMWSAGNTVAKAISEMSPQLSEAKRKEQAEKDAATAKAGEVKDASMLMGNVREGAMLVEMRETNRLLKTLVQTGQFNVGAPVTPENN